jgi:hypothetical protein
MQRYSFTASWVPGKQNVMADALSRSPIDQPSPTDEIAEGPRSASERVHLMDVMEGSSSANPDILLSSVSTASAVDPVMISLRRTILKASQTISETFLWSSAHFGRSAANFPSTMTSSSSVLVSSFRRLYDRKFYVGSS